MAPGDKRTIVEGYRVGDCTWMRTVVITLTEAHVLYATGEGVMEVDGSYYARMPSSTFDRLTAESVAKPKRVDERPWVRSRAEQWKANRTKWR